jgi:hypothetical protein
MAFTSPAAPAALDKGATCVATAPAPKVAAEIWRNFLRERCSMAVFPGLRRGVVRRHADCTPDTPHPI